MIKHNLRRMAITVPGAIGNDRGLGTHALQKILGGCVLRSMMRDLDHLGLQIQVPLAQQSFLGLTFRVAHQQH